MEPHQDISRLELRIKELEDQLKELRASRETPQVTNEELQVYLKVRNILGWDWECGINECMRCIPVGRCGGGGVVRCINRCIFECSCGPCNVGGGGGFFGGGGGRFGGLGE